MVLESSSNQHNDLLENQQLELKRLQEELSLIKESIDGEQSVDFNSKSQSLKEIEKKMQALDKERDSERQKTDLEMNELRDFIDTVAQLDESLDRLQKHISQEKLRKQSKPISGAHVTLPDSYTTNEVIVSRQSSVDEIKKQAQTGTLSKRVTNFLHKLGISDSSDNFSNVA